LQPLCLTALTKRELPRNLKMIIFLFIDIFGLRFSIGNEIFTAQSASVLDPGISETVECNN
jgi:hypothetical protein